VFKKAENKIIEIAPIINTIKDLVIKKLNS